MSIHQEAALPASPESVYEMLTDAATFAAATGRPAEIETKEGGAFAVFGGVVHGRQIELVPGRRVVQAWRFRDWAPGVYSCVRFTLRPDGEGTLLAVDHDGYPGGASPRYPSWHEHLATNWPVFYLEPLARYLTS